MCDTHTGLSWFVRLLMQGGKSVPMIDRLVSFAQLATDLYQAPYLWPHFLLYLARPYYTLHAPIIPCTPLLYLALYDTTDLYQVGML